MAARGTFGPVAAGRFDGVAVLRGEVRGAVGGAGPGARCPACAVGISGREGGEAWAMA